MKILPSIDTGMVQLAVIECDCGYHMTFDNSYLDQVVEGRDGAGEISQTCPACRTTATYILKQDGEDECL